jgi:hypothetical protein
LRLRLRLGLGLNQGEERRLKTRAAQRAAVDREKVEDATVTWVVRL